MTEQFISQEFERDEISSWRKESLPVFLAVIPLGALLWYSLLPLDRLKWVSIAVPLGFGGLTPYLVWRLRTQRYALAVGLLLVSMLVVQILMLDLQRFSASVASGVLIVTAAYVLAGPAESFAVTVILVAITALAPLRALDAWAGYWAARDALIVYCAIWVSLYVVGRPLKKAAEFTFAGWAEARRALIELRLRRAEIYRALRALEEATGRIERANNELLLAQREAEVARAIKARLAATVSHELRGPLNYILGFSELMAFSPENYGAPLPKAYRADINSIHRHSQHLLALIDDVLDLSKIEANELPLVKDRIDLDNDVIDKVISNVQPLAERKGLYLRHESPGNLPGFLADAVRLRQALLNLLTNAIRFTDSGGILVRTSCQGTYLQVSVEDTGRGIPAEIMPKLFREFQQLQPPELGEGSVGSGLGLAISKHLIELHGGWIWAESQLHMGTSFHFALPLSGVESAEADWVRTPTTSVPKGAPICLVFHEDPRVVGIMERYIGGYRVMGVSDKEDLLALVDELHPQAIVADPEIVQGLCAALSTTVYEVPIISCTLPHLAQVESMRGVLRYLVKPLTSDMLTEAMNQVKRDEITVLLVDDEPDAVHLMERMLTRLPHPYKILKAYDGLEAWEAISETIPDIVFMDLMLPKLSGEQVIERMQADARTGDIPVVVVSARDWLDDAAVVETPISLYCQTPVNIAQAVRCVRFFLDNFKANYHPESVRRAQP